MKKVIFSILLGLSVFGTVHSESYWVKLYEQKGVTTYFDYSRLDSEKHRGWFKTIIPDGIGLELKEGDCSERKIRTIHMTIYDDKMRFIGEEDYPSSDLEYVTPDSNGEKQLNVLCW